ncbi:MAG: arylsulfatase, partial [Planctomycetales bacterium]
MTTSLLVSALLLIGAAPESPQTPNVVVILADDMGIGDLGIYNPDSKIPTPNMDRLAREGLRMTDMHSPSAVCTPTRYGLLTGRYCWRTRLKESVLFGYGTSLIDAQRMTLASMLKKHDFNTAVFGKWHLGLGEGKKTDYSQPLSPGPLTVGFDRFYGIPASLDMAPYVYVDDTSVVEKATETIESENYIRWGGKGYIVGGKIAPSFRHVDVLPITTEKTVEFIEGQTKEKPFFVYVPFSAPHTPWAPTDKFKGTSKAGTYGDFTVMVEDCVGRILAAIDQLGVADNTIVIVTSDNGSHWLPEDIEQYDHRGNLHLRGQKADIHEGGHRVPFIVRWPGQIKADTVNDRL